MILGSNNLHKIIFNIAKERKIREKNQIGVGGAENLNQPLIMWPEPLETHLPVLLSIYQGR